jgi:hypothetical protein
MRVLVADGEEKYDQSRQFASSNMNDAHKIARFLVLMNVRTYALSTSVLAMSVLYMSVLHTSVLAKSGMGK